MHRPKAAMQAMERDFHKRDVGKYVRWTGGYIKDIVKENGAYVCHIEMDPGKLLSTADIHCYVTKQEAMALRTDHEIRIDGEITSVSGSLDVRIRQVELTHTGRTYLDLVEARTGKASC